MDRIVINDIPDKNEEKNNISPYQPTGNFFCEPLARYPNHQITEQSKWNDYHAHKKPDSDNSRNKAFVLQPILHQ